MEGYKLRALFEPELCARSAEKRIGDELLGIIARRLAGKADDLKVSRQHPAFRGTHLV